MGFKMGGSSRRGQNPPNRIGPPTRQIFVELKGMANLYLRDHVPPDEHEMRDCSDHIKRPLAEVNDKLLREIQRVKKQVTDMELTYFISPGGELPRPLTKSEFEEIRLPSGLALQ